MYIGKDTRTDFQNPGPVHDKLLPCIVLSGISLPFGFLTSFEMCIVACCFGTLLE
ncbi:hypothetical protein RchiOBHm_Chr6g0264791 [Rosa chinensis]|uniref:Uncharacterized protein n=1 Tax=Rosa chinensis TaxID=74649 RepID=A0A2P6PP90_ROSCH|nr:hypothetical protein RchiOBHm_Chr6g0264791 [Rosa chinensis]